MELLPAIEEYLRRSGITPTRFGRIAMRDPRFVLDLRNGREPNRRTCARIRAYLAAHATGAAR